MKRTAPYCLLGSRPFVLQGISSYILFNGWFTLGFYIKNSANCAQQTRSFLLNLPKSEPSRKMELEEIKFFFVRARLNRSLIF
ncbi:hypothetical protein EEL30_04975 [Brevibacillus laterosporus]|uniref:Uncharacterized protein n=1 Tax=Brevibacillus laterosporus TaxID=1465 RepID=A0A518V457_BRELA|nr:hypothetical protein EEL30_04975 [Brevibacillus laterosporus]